MAPNKALPYSPGSCVLMGKYFAASTVSTFAGVCCSMANAGWALNPLSVGGESHAMGGVEIPLANGAMAAATNPAGLQGVDNGDFSLFGEVFYFGQWGHRDSVGNDTQTEPPYAPVGGGAFAFRPDFNRDFVFGFALTAAGGVGFNFPDQRTEYGDRDDMAGIFGVYRISPALAWQATDSLTFGASLGWNYSEAEQKLFPNTSEVSSETTREFYGLRADGMSGDTWSYRLGLQYQLGEQLTVGFTYVSPTKLELRGGEGMLNLSATPIGEKVRYGDAEMKGLALAEEVGIGASWTATPRIELAIELNWLNWGDAINSTRLIMRRPDNDNAQSVIRLKSPIHMGNQLGFSFGGRYQWKDQTALMAGYAYSDNPFPKKNTTPLLNIIGEHHLTVGVSHNINTQWRLVGTYFYLLPNKVNISNTDFPIGDSTELYAKGHDLSITLQRSW